MESLTFLFVMSILAVVTLLLFRTFTAWKLHTSASKLHAECPSEAVQWTSGALAFLLHMNPIAKPFIVLLLFQPYRTMTQEFIISTWRCVCCVPGQS